MQSPVPVPIRAVSKMSRFIAGGDRVGKANLLGAQIATNMAEDGLTVDFHTTQAGAHLDHHPLIAAWHSSPDRVSIARPSGKNLPLRVGMRGEAHIIVGGRTPIEFVLEPIHQLRENMRE